MGKDKCPKCGGKLVFIKNLISTQHEKICFNADCNFKIKVKKSC